MLMGIFVFVTLSFITVAAWVSSVESITELDDLRTYYGVYDSKLESSRQRPNAANCSLEWIEQPLDHFNYVNSQRKYKERVFIYDKYWKPDGPIFFYCGNEGDVTLYVNNTGLMWQNAKKFGAVLVFAEHRYYGQSHPFHFNNSNENMQFLTHEQALADYANLLYLFKEKHNATASPVIAFGGSYGGMLATWFRIKYPSAIDGAIAASAPIFAFQQADQAATYRGASYWKVVTLNAQAEAGSAVRCAPNVRRSWSILKNYAKTDAGRQKLHDIFKLCEKPTNEAQVDALSLSIMMAFDTMAMGNYPYPSSYLTEGVSLLPAWPVRKACEYLKDELPNEENLLAALRDAAGVYNNASQSLTCNPLPKLSDFDGIFDYQWCTQMMPQESYFDTNGISDMFWLRNVSMESISHRCQHVWGTTPRPYWMHVSYGGRELKGASNIVFTNGRLDPWNSGGVSTASDPSIATVWIDDGAHHLDLFFSHPDDPPSVIEARKIQVQHISKWIKNKRH